MDVAYDHIQEENFPDDEEGQPHDKKEQRSLSGEFQDAYNAFSQSQWGVKLGGLWGTVKKQGEHYYQEAQKEYNSASTSASKNFNELLNRTRSLSLTQQSPEHVRATDEDPSASTTTERAPEEGSTDNPERAENLPADIVKEAESMLSRFRSEAAKRLKDIERAEDAADEALLRFGTNIRNFLRDAVSIAPPSQEEIDSGSSKVLFESKDSEGKRVIHGTRMEAQLHVIHCSMESFLKDPASKEYGPWAEGFDVESHTGDVSRDLEKYEELRRAMEKCVPEKVDYGTFWKRYYFLRHVVEEEEKRRRELLKGAAENPDEEIRWDEDSDSDDALTPHPASASQTTLKQPKSRDGSTSGTKDAEKQDAETATLKPTEPRRSNDQHSQSGSDASYDIISGASSRAPGSPKEGKGEESDEDWE